MPLTCASQGQQRDCDCGCAVRTSRLDMYLAHRPAHPVRAWSAVRQSVSGRERHASCPVLLTGNCTVAAERGTREDGRKRRTEETAAAHEQWKRVTTDQDKHASGTCTQARDSETRATNRQKKQMDRSEISILPTQPSVERKRGKRLQPPSQAGTMINAFTFWMPLSDAPF